MPTRRNFMPNPANPGPLIRAGSVVEDIGTTVMYNLHRGSAPGRFERRVVNTNMPTNKLAEFTEFIGEEGQALLERVDAWLSENEGSDNDDKEPLRIGLGMYFIKRDE